MDDIVQCIINYWLEHIHTLWLKFHEIFQSGKSDLHTHPSNSISHLIIYNYSSFWEITVVTWLTSSMTIHGIHVTINNGQSPQFSLGISKTNENNNYKRYSRSDWVRFCVWFVIEGYTHWLLKCSLNRKCISILTLIM